jgi:hypothetical protein
MGRHGGRSSEKAGARDFQRLPDNVVALDANTFALLNNDHSAEIIAFDAAAKNPSQALARRRETLTYQKAHKENELWDTEQARRAKLNAFNQPKTQPQKPDTRTALAQQMVLELTKKRDELRRLGVVPGWETEHENLGVKKDKRGTELRNGEALTRNGLVVRVGETYQLKGGFLGMGTGDYFHCERLSWRNGDVVAVGSSERGHSYSTQNGVWVYPDQLKPANVQGGKMRSGKGRLFGVEI